MPQAWANHGLDLHLNLAGPRVRAGLESALRDAVRTGRLAAGVRLPSSRDLAADVGVARNTVAEAYAQLVAEGWLTARTGSGTWVSERPAVTASAAGVPAEQPRPPRYDLRAGVPAVSAFPRREWLATARAALGAAADDVLGYPDPRGLPELRMALVGYLSRTRGVIADPERVIICGGFSHGLALTCWVLARQGAGSLAVEDYGHQAYRRIVRSHGLRAITLAIDDLGAMPGAALDATVRQDRAGAVLLTPAHQYPLGMSLAPARRTAFVARAARSGGLVIEDDYDGEFRYDRQPVGAMQSLAPDLVVYAGTASKSLAPGLRLGWLVVPTRLVAGFVAAKESLGAHSSVLDQLALARLIESGGYDRQVRRARLLYRRRRDRLVAALRREAPRVRLTGIAAGQHVVAALPDDVSEDDVVTRAAENGLAVEGLAHYANDPVTGSLRRWGPALVIGYGRPADHAFTAALGRLCAVLAEVT
jgi:GntR family transcriptional regulator/MocR family aminotransferase